MSLYKAVSIFFAASLMLVSPANADFGDADFPENLFRDGPKSYHDAWCRKIKNKCRVRFQGKGMWVEGQGGIQRSQLKGLRTDFDGGEYYNYVDYVSSAGAIKTALFLFSNFEANREFLRALVRWQRMDARPVPNYRLPASQGPQDAQGRDKSYGIPMNPYERPPITDWKEKTTP